jgi:hypothetical protein
MVGLALGRCVYPLPANTGGEEPLGGKISPKREKKWAVDRRRPGVVEMSYCGSLCSVPGARLQPHL